MAAQKRLQQTQAQVDEVSKYTIWSRDWFTANILIHYQVVGIMRVNVEKVLERDQKLSELDDRAGMLLLFVFIACKAQIYVFFDLFLF